MPLSALAAVIIAVALALAVAAEGEVASQSARAETRSAHADRAETRSRPADSPASVPLSIAVDGNHFVNGAGQTVRLLGVDRPGTEYACQEGWGDSDGDDDPLAAVADAASLSAWGIDAVRVPLNEDCWLGINGQPSYPTVASYRQTVEQFVSDLNAVGIYAILDLHWSAPASVIADGQRPMPDAHSSAFWTSVAGTFVSNPAVLFDAFNEPYSPAADFNDAYSVDWSCWRDGGCLVPVTVDGTNPGADPQTYTAVGMQALVNAIRATGATQPILLGGLAYANDLSGWLAHEPVDPAGQLAASFHNYEGEACASSACWNGVIAPVAAQVPVVAGEFDENECPATGDGFDQSFMDWADATGVSYLAWGWYVGAAPECGDYYLIDASGDPVAPNGTALHDHLAALAANPPAAPPPTVPPPSSPAPPPTVTTPSSPSTTPTVTPPSSASTPTVTPPSSASTPTVAPPTSPTPTVGQPMPPLLAPPAGPTSRRQPSVATTADCQVPRLTGDTLAAARRRLAADHCRVGRITQPRASRTDGRHAHTSAPARRLVARQAPRAGARRPRGTRVSLWLRAARPLRHARGRVLRSATDGIDRASARALLRPGAHRRVAGRRVASL